MEKKQNNGGYSLIELIVAIVIIALVVGPILYSFYNASRMNQRAKEQLEASTAAQNIMEEIKASQLDKLLATTGVAVVKTDDDYTLTYSDVKVADKTYKVVAELKASEYKAAAGDPANYNDYELPEISKMDSAHNGFYVPVAGVASTMAEDFDNALGVTDSYKTMTKVTTIDIDKAATMETAKVSIQYKETGGTIREEANNSYIYRDTSGTSGLQGVYIYYEPLYNTTVFGRNAREKIVINNNGLLPVTVYLIKQRTAEYNVGNESNYAVEIEVNENTRTQDWTTIDDYKPITVVQTNLDEEQMILDYNAPVTAFASDIMVGLDELTGGDVEAKLYKVEVIVYDEDDEEQVRITGTKEK